MFGPQKRTFVNTKVQQNDCYNFQNTNVITKKYIRYKSWFKDETNHQDRVQYVGKCYYNQNQVFSYDFRFKNTNFNRIELN